MRRFDGKNKSMDEHDTAGSQTDDTFCPEFREINTNAITDLTSKYDLQINVTTDSKAVNQLIEELRAKGEQISAAEAYSKSYDRDAPDRGFDRGFDRTISGDC